MLDVTFTEEASRIRRGNGPEVSSVFRRLALNILQRDTSLKCSLRVKRKRCGWDELAFEKLLAGFCEAQRSIALRSYRRHKASGQAIVIIAGKDHYLGPYDSAISRDASAKLISASPVQDSRSAEPEIPQFEKGTPATTLVELLAEFIT